MVSYVEAASIRVSIAGSKRMSNENNHFRRADMNLLRAGRAPQPQHSHADQHVRVPRQEHTHAKTGNGDNSITKATNQLSAKTCAKAVSRTPRL